MYDPFRFIRLIVLTASSERIVETAIGTATEIVAAAQDLLIETVAIMR
jgi:hypothetical protein